MRAVLFLFIAMIATLVAAYFGFSVYFCSGALKGDFGGCMSMASGDVFRSTIVQIAIISCGISAFYVFRGRARK